jgi:chromosome segregation ATPase
MNDQRKIEIANAALLKYADELEQSAAYWKSETDRAWETAKRWRDEEEAKTADVRENMDALCRQIEAIGARIPVNTGGTMERDPCDAILGQILLLVTK